MKKKGFTLVELIAAMGILAIIVLALGNASSTGIGVTKKVTQRSELYNCNQYIMQTLKNRGKNYIKFLYGGSTEYKGYFYFNDEAELSNILENNSYTAGNETQFINNKPSIGKNYGAYMEFTTTDVIGKNGAADVKLSYGLDTVKLKIKVYRLDSSNNDNSELVVYLGR